MGFGKKKEKMEQPDTNMEVEFVNGNQEEEKKEKKHGSRVTVWLVLTVAVLLLYFALVAVGSAFANDYKNYEVPVYVPAADVLKVEKGTLITEENVNKLFTSAVRDSRTIPSDYISDLSLLIGKFAAKDIGQMEIVCESGFYDLDMKEGILNPVEVSFSVNSFDQAVGGVLRRGDCISLYVVRKDEAEKEVTAEKIVDSTYVTRAFSSAGMEIDREDAENADTPTTIINIYIPKAQEDAYNRAISEGTLRVSRDAG